MKLINVADDTYASPERCVLRIARITADQVRRHRAESLRNRIDLASHHSLPLHGASLARAARPQTQRSQILRPNGW